ncbi:hypothetical protein AB6A23_01515 [Paenibacillus tarimensis]
MQVVWIIVAVIIVIAIIAAIVAAANRWQSVKSEGGSRAERIDRLQAYLKSFGIKSKIASGVANTVQLKVLKKDIEQAKKLVEKFDEEF